MMREGKKDEAVGFGTKVLRKEKRKRDNMGVREREREVRKQHIYFKRTHVVSYAPLPWYYSYSVFL